MNKIAIARPFEWDVSKHPEKPWQEWYDKRYGFHIEFVPGEEPEDAYQASWGEGDAENFATLEAAQDWCQAEINGWIADNVLIVDASIEACDGN